MRIGLQIPKFTWPGGPEQIGSTLASVARAADDGGFYSLWLMDHFFQIRGVGTYTEPMLEGYAGLSYLAALTKNVRLGTMVTGVVYRYPAVLVKTVTTLDVLSGGRAYLGIGAAWNEQESKALGIPFPSVKVRFELLEEALQIAHQMWSDNNGPYEGKHNHLTETLNMPQPLSKPHPPILIGGMGEKKTLRMVAQYADACNLFSFGGMDMLRNKLDILKRHCDEVGRDYNEIELTAYDNVGAGPVAVKDVITRQRALADLGFTHTIFAFGDVYTLATIDTFAREIIPVVAGF